MNSFVENKLFCVLVYPGQKTPETPEHCAAADIKKMGRLDRFASANPVSHVVYQAIPDSPTACSFGIILPGVGGPPRWANAGRVVKTINAKEE